MEEKEATPDPSPTIERVCEREILSSAKKCSLDSRGGVGSWPAGVVPVPPPATTSLPARLPRRVELPAHILLTHSAFWGRGAAVGPTFNFPPPRVNPRMYVTCRTRAPPNIRKRHVTTSATRRPNLMLRRRSTHLVQVASPQPRRDTAWPATCQTDSHFLRFYVPTRVNVERARGGANQP